MRVLEAAVLFFGGLAAHWFASTQLSLWGLSPHVLFALTLGAAAAAGPVQGQCLGFFWGLALDALSGHVFGANALGLTLTAYGVGMLRRQMDTASPPSQAVLAAATVPLYALYYGFAGSLFEHRFLWPGWGSFLLDPVYTALLAPLAFSTAKRFLRP